MKRYMPITAITILALTFTGSAYAGEIAGT